MRNSTLVTASIATLSALYLGQNMAIQNQQPLTLVVQPVDQQTQASSASAETNTLPNPEPESPAVTKQETKPTEPSQPTTETPTEAPPPSQEPTQPTPAPAPAEEPAPVAEPQAPVKVTVNSDPVNYEYGVIQLSVTSVDGTLTNVSMLQGETSFGRGDAYTALISATISAQGTNFGNYSGATFTTEAFKSAVANAIGKL